MTDEKTMKNVIADIFKSAKKKGLKNVSIRIYENLNCVLYVGKNDRLGCGTLDLLLESLSEEKDLSWMNEKNHSGNQIKETTKIRFFYFDKLLGEFDCPEASNIKDREKIAIDNALGLWTHFILGNNRIMGVQLNEHKHDLRGERGEFSTADYLPLPTGEYLVWMDAGCMTVTIKKENE